ncbi:MAG TPA: hypothetical protein VFQ52_09945 [Rhizomicrobium sp.]|nr:hypothetical protein [Rhizomicrobium sp.]
MTHLSMDPLTLSHVAITLIAIASGLLVLAQMLKNTLSGGLTGLFLATTLLTSVTGFVFFHPANPPTPGQIVGVVALVILAPTLAGLYLKHLAGAWRAIYVIGAVISLYLNVFVLVNQLFTKVPSPFQPLEGHPPAGPAFGAVQGIVLLAFVVAGWRATKTFHPIGHPVGA